MNEVDTIEKFEAWFLSIPGADETLLDKNPDGSYCDHDIELLKSAFEAGFRSSMNDCLNLVSKYKVKV